MHDVTLKAFVVLAAALPLSFTPALDMERGNPPLHAPLTTAELAPEVLLSTLVNELLALVKQRQAAAAPTSLDLPPESLTTAMEPRIRSLFDIETMTKLVLGRNWRLASPEQQAALTVEFGHLLVHTCVSALASSNDPSVAFKTLMPVPGEDTITVRSFVSQPGRKPWTIDHDMKKTPAGWKVVDIKVEGMRLVTIHRDAFAELVRDAGVDGLLASLTAWNQRGEVRTADARQHLPAALILMHIATQRGLIGGG